MTPRIPTAISPPVKAVISLLVCLGLNPKRDKRFLPNLVPTESPSTESPALPKTSEKINSQLVSEKNCNKVIQLLT